MNRKRVKRYIYLMKEIVGDGVEGCDGDDGVGKSSGLELRSWRSRDMEMYPQKRFAPGRRRINAAHHVLTQPIGTFFPRYACFCTFVFQMSRAPQGNLYFCGCFYKLKLSRAQTKGHPVQSRTTQCRLRHQDHHPNQTIISRTGSSTTPWKNLEHQSANETFL